MNVAHLESLKIALTQCASRTVYNLSRTTAFVRTYQKMGFTSAQIAGLPLCRVFWKRAQQMLRHGAA